MTDGQGDVHILKKSESKVLSMPGIREALETFLSPDDSVARERRRKAFLLQLNEIWEVMQKQTSFQFISSSLLFAYGALIDSKEETVRIR